MQRIYIYIFCCIGVGASSVPYLSVAGDASPEDIRVGMGIDGTVRSEGTRVERNCRLNMTRASQVKLQVSSEGTSSARLARLSHRKPAYPRPRSIPTPPTLSIILDMASPRSAAHVTTPTPSLSLSLPSRVDQYAVEVMWCRLIPSTPFHLPRPTPPRRC